MQFFSLIFFEFKKMLQITTVMDGASVQANTKLQTLQDSGVGGKAALLFSLFTFFPSLGNGKHLTENTFRHVL